MSSELYRVARQEKRVETTDFPEIQSEHFLITPDGFSLPCGYKNPAERRAKYTALAANMAPPLMRELMECVAKLKAFQEAGMECPAEHPAKNGYQYRGSLAETIEAGERVLEEARELSSFNSLFPFESLPEYIRQSR